MKALFKIFLFSFFVFCSLFSISQNLVPNPSFEMYDTCPNTLDQVNYAIGWNAFAETPDYYNSCASTSSYASTPFNFAGYQIPLSGNAYCGFQAYSYATDVHEILGCSLISPLTIGQKYYVTFNIVNAGVVAGPGFNCFTNKIGARFSTIHYTYTNPAPINNFANIYTDSIIKDTINWHTISGSFIADSSYQYFGIGNFFQDINTDTIKLTTWAARAYYLVDNICISTDSIYANTWTSISEIKNKNKRINIYPNPTSDNVHISYEGNNLPVTVIYNSTGEVVLPKIIFNQNNIELDMNSLDAGIYYIHISIGKEDYSEKIILIK